MYTLDPLLESLMNYASDEDLTHKLKSLFQRFDIDEDSVITYQEMYEGLHKGRTYEKETTRVGDSRKKILMAGSVNE